MNYDANTIEEAKEYLQVRYRELASVRISVVEELNYEDKAVVTIYSNGFGSLYILKDFRGIGLYKKLLQIFMIPIVTMEDCKIVPYLESIGCTHMVVSPSNAYLKIREYYGNTVTVRSKVKLINHIDEGIGYLNEIGASQDAIDGYCLHPMLQADEDLITNWNADFKGITYKAVILAMEYRRVANSYLSTGKRSDFVDFTSTDIFHMLYADKKQNEKDFKLYHEGTHERSKELREYFNNWFELLDIKN